MRRVLVVLVGLALVAGCDAVKPGPTGTTAAVPKVTGARLSDAVTTLGDAGFHKINPTDAGPENRVIVDSENWVVDVQEPAAGTTVDTGTRITLRVRKPTDGAGAGTVTGGVVPDVVCKDLQSAQDTLQKAGFFNVSSQDGTGQDRLQIVDRNWLVTRQSAAPGSRPDKKSRITLTAVKYGEPTGDSGCKS